MRDLLRPKPFRGDQVAAGTVFLTVLIVLLQVRFSGRWSDGAQMFVAGSAALLVLAMALPLPTDGSGPRAYLSTLYICAWGLTLIALIDLAVVLGSHLFTAGTVMWISAVLFALSLFFSRRRDAASSTLLAGLSGTVAFAEFVNWSVGINSVADLRRALLVVVLAVGLGALWQRVRGPAHGVQLLNVLGLVVLFIALTFIIGIVFGLVLSSHDGPFGLDVHAGTGWAALVLLTGVSLVAAGAADGERGNVVVGIVNLGAFVVLASTGNLVGWPILLAVGAGTLLVIGLRPSTPLPPEPQGDDDDPGPLVTLRPL